MKITLNGKETAVEDGKTLQALLKDMGIAPELIACELNQAIVRRKDFAGLKISEGDILEIIQMIGGG